MPIQNLTLSSGHATLTVRRLPRRCTIIAWDTKTTGTGPEDRIIEISLREVCVSDGREAREYSVLIDPERGVPNSNVHGISDTDLVGWPKFAEVWPCIRQFVQECVGPDGGKPILVSHNSEFDGKDMLAKELQRLGRSLPDWHFASSSHLSEYVWPRRANYALDAFLPTIGVENEAEDTAVGDARAIAGLLQKADQRMTSSRCQSRIRKFRHNSQQSRAAYSNRYWRQGDALRRLIFMMLISSPARPSGPTAFSLTESESAAYPAPPGHRSPRLTRAVPGGGFFCTRLGEKFHDCQCEGLEDATLIYEINGPPEDRDDCYFCAQRRGHVIISDGSGLSASLQIEQHLESLRIAWS